MAAQASTSAGAQTGFLDLALDPRLQRALAKRGFAKPSAVQAACVPEALAGRDIVARARTGSGKTLAYLLPALHRVLSSEEVVGSFKAIVLVPTRELCEQVKQEAQTITEHCGTEIQVTALLGEGSQQLKRAVANAGHVVVATPGKLAAALREGFLSPATLQEHLQMLVLDEADLLLSYGYEEDLQLIAPQVPRSCQCMLMSATVSEEVERLTKLVLHNPVTLNLLAKAGDKAGAQGELAEGSGTASEIEHFSFECAAEDKLLVTMAMLKLALVKKKVLIFVNTVDRGYQLRLFLESFGVRSALLNAELPLNSRSHILQSFNRGLFDYLIATDDVHTSAHDQKGAAAAAQGKKRKRGEKALLGKDGSGRKGRGGPKKDEEFGVTRGIDFKGVRTVINYDLPSSTQGYVHRVGRTGRAGQRGVAITLFTPKDVEFREDLLVMLKEAAGSQEEDDEEAEEQEEGQEGRKEKGPLRTFSRLPKVQVEALRYRGEDVARSLTKNTIKEARAKELKAEILNSERLKGYFEEHAAEKMLLRHDKPLHKTPQAAHLKHVPGYLKDPTLITERSFVGSRGRQPLSHKKQRKHDRALGVGQGGPSGAAGAEGKDPLKEVKGFARTPKRGAEQEEDLTEMEKRAMQAGKKEAKKRAKLAGIPVVPKQNVRKLKRRR